MRRWLIHPKDTSRGLNLLPSIPKGKKIQDLRAHTVRTFQTLKGNDSAIPSSRTAKRVNKWPVTISIQSLLDDSLDDSEKLASRQTGISQFIFTKKVANFVLNHPRAIWKDKLSNIICQFGFTM